MTTIHIITLAVADLERSLEFWNPRLERSHAPKPTIAKKPGN